jgi:acyl carrier protein
VLHRGIVRLVTNTDYARFAPDEVFLHLAPSSFDASSFEIWGALLNGAELALSPTDKPSIDDLDALLRRHRVTTLWLTAALFNLVIDTRPRLLATLHQLLIGGEALSVPHVEKALALLPGVALINGYGPTENTTFSCCHRIREARGLSSIPIGRPIANSSAHVLDARGEPLPLGFPGELHVGGDGVAAGYFGRPELTEARFWPDPFCAEPGARLYRTGDRVRRLGDGSLEFLGRLDEQIKLRGYRIEPGEIEAALSAHPGISATRVLARRGPDATARLLGYFIPRGEAPSPEALRSHLARTLPDYMIPADFVALSAFPLTRHGKIDLAALPDPTHAPRRGPPARLPKSALEALILALFRELLGNATADIDDDFFLLGGHSLLATRLLARLATRVGIELPLRTLFEAKSPARLAARIEELVAGGAARARPPLTPAPASERWPLSFAQQRLWLIDQLEPGSTAYLIPLGLCLRGALDLSALARSLGAIVERHEALRTVFPLRNGEPEQVIRPPALTLHEVDLRGAPEPELAARELARA